MVEEYIRNTIAEFNEKAKTDEKLKASLQNFERVVVIKLDDGRAFHFLVSQGRAGDLQKGAVENAQVVIESDAETVEKLCKREIRIMKAYATRKLRIKASLEDIVRLRNFF